MILDTLINLLRQDINDGDLHKFAKFVNEKPGTDYDMERKRAWFYFYNSGFVFGTDPDMRINDIRVYFREADDITPYKEPISDNIGPKSTKSSIISIYGIPAKEGVPNPTPLYPGHIPTYWASYVIDDYWMHFEFTIETGKLEEVTLMTPESVPGNRPGDQELAKSLNKL